MSNKIKMSAVAAAVGFAFASHGAIAAPSFDKAYQPETSSVKNYSQEKYVQLKTRYIVQLEDEPLATYSGGVVGFSATSAQATGDDKLNLKSHAAVQYGTYLKKQQKTMSATIAAKTGAKSVKSFNTLFNALVVEGEEGQQAALAALPGVKKVFLDTEYHTLMDASLDVIKGVEAWTALGGKSEAGKGVKVAIIDSGIRPENPMFSDEGMAAPEFTQEQLDHLATNPDYCRSPEGDANFCNNKLIVARWFGPITSNLHPDEYMTPLGYDSHGTHVAGTAVGNQIDVTFQGSDVTLSGVAPAAYLMAYKALWHKTDGRASGRSSDLALALEAAVKDGADVINNSWGGGAGGNPASSPYVELFEAAEAAGVVVVTAAGNDGNGAQTIGCPGCIESGLTVANTQTGRFFSQTIEIAGESYLSVEGSNGLLSETLQLPLVAAHFAEPDNAEGCNEYAEGVSFADSVALVSRGSCAFTTKAQNAAKAGAKAIIIHNNAPGGAMGMSMDEAPIPASAVSLEDGEKILEILQAAEDTLVATLDPTITRTVLEKFTDAVNTSSSRGPGGEPSFLKPDIAAPGTDILSAVSPDEDNGLTISTKTGTSMASPHVAGAAALMKQSKPDWSAVQIKTALMSTSKMDGLHKEDLVTKADAFDVGAGRLDVPSALDAAVTFAKGSYADPSCLSVCSFTNTMTNMLDEAGEWTGKIVTDMDGAEFTLSPSTINLTAAGTEGAEATFNLDIDTTYNAVKDWNFGHVVWTHTSGKVAHLPFAVYDNETSNASALVANVDADSLNSQTPASMSVEFTNIAYEDDFEIAIEFTDALVEQSVFAGEGEISVSPVGNTVNWKGSIQKASITLEPQAIGSGTGSISDEVTPVACGGCDEFSVTVPASFKFAGKEYSAFTVSDNGFIAVGADVDMAGAYAPQAMPSQITPNGVIAPLWTDYDLEGGNTGGGQLYIGLSSDENGDKYYIVEWHKAHIYDGDGTEYTFQVIIKEGTDDIRINYLDVPKLPASYSAGAESDDGTIGAMIETVPTGTSLDKSYIVNQVAGGTVKLDFQARASNMSKYTSADAVSTDEQQTVNIAVLDNDTAESRFKFTANVSSETSTDEYSAGKGVRVTGSPDASTVTVVDAPKFGIATPKEDGTIDYMPAQGFSGSDSFTYTVSDLSGAVSNPTTVSVTVNDTIPAPTPDVTPAPKSSSGSLAWLALLAAPFAMLRRRKQK